MIALTLIPLVAFVVLIILIAKITGNSTRIRNLEWEVRNIHGLERQVNELSAYVDSLRKENEELSAPRRKKVEPAEVIVIPSKGTEQAPPLITPPVAELRPSVQKPIEPQTPSRTREEWEALIGGKLLNRIGALALIIGIGFFLKYAFDNNWINETTRVLTGAAIGFVCLAGGYRTNKRGFGIFAQGLVGAGIAILYLSVYAAFNFYHLVPQWTAFVLMSIVTVIAFANGLFYDSLAEVVLGWAGGFLTPVLLSTGQANEIGLFSYICILDIGLIALAVKKEQWRVLEPLTLAGTWIMYLMWRDPYYTDEDLWMTVVFITVFWLLFFVLDILRSRKGTKEDVSVQIVPGLNALFYFAALYFLINKDNHSWMGITTLLIGAIYFVVLTCLQTRAEMSTEVRMRYTLTAAILMVLATSIQFYDFDTVIFWSFEASLLMWCSKEWKVGYIRTAALLLFGVALFKLLFVTEGALMYSPIRNFSLLFNHRAATFAILASALGISATFVDTTPDAKNRRIVNALHFAWCATVFLLLTAETIDFFRFKMLDVSDAIQNRMAYFRIMTLGVIWITYSLPLVWVGLKRRLFPLLVSGLACALLAIVFGCVRGIAFAPLDNYAPFFNVRSVALVLLATGLLLQTQYIQKSRDAFNWIGDILTSVQVGMIVVILVLLTGETRDFFQTDIERLTQQAGLFTSDVSRLINLQQMSLSGIWLLYSLVLMSLGIWRQYRGIRFAAIGLFGITILKIFIYDLSFLDTLYRIFSFLALGLILLAVSYAYQKYKDVIIGKT